MDILNLINNQNWNKITKKIKNKRIDINKQIYDGNYLIHYIGLSNNEQLFKVVSDKKYGLDMYLVNRDKETVGHIAAKYGYIHLLKKIVQKKPTILNKLDKDDNTILNLLWQNNDILKYFFKEHGKSINSINNVNKFGENILISNIKKSNIDNVKLIANNGANLNYPKQYPPIICATDTNNLKIVKVLKEMGADINAKDKSYTTALIVAVMKKNKDIVEYLLKNNVDHDYIGSESDEHTVIIAIYNKDIDILKLLLDNNVNINQSSRYLDTPAHFMFMQLTDNSYSVIPIELRAKILDKTEDLNKKNIKGNTVLHYLIKNDDWNKYKKVLFGRRIDVTIKNNKGETPLSYIKDEKDKKNLVDFIYKNYVDILKSHTYWAYTFDYKCSKYLKKNNINKFTKICEKKIRDNLIIKKSYPIESHNIGQDISIIHNDYAISGKFSTTTIYNVIYTLIILKKYSNLIIPFVYNPLIRQQLGFNNTESSSIYDIYKNKIGQSVVDLTNIYTKVMTELANFMIVWYDKNIHYIPINLQEAILISISRPGIKFIFIRLSLIVTETMNHANILIYDIENNTIERFDPYGVVPYGTPDDLDDHLEKYFKKIIKKDIQYLRPKDYMNNVSFQIISNENNKMNQKFGDPGGYCLAWVYWYVEMRLMNKNVKPKILIEKLINKINDSDLTFLEHIRNYANELDKQKTFLFAKAGLSEKNWYSSAFSQEDIILIIKQINQDFDKIFY